MLRTSTVLLAVFLAICASAAEPQIIQIKTLQAQMRYDVTEFTVAPDADVKIIFENVDDMPHNLVLFQAGTDVVAVSNKNMEKPEEALKRDWLPNDPGILAHSKMVNPKTTDEIVFKAPANAGAYPYVCTFPGHALNMQGKMKVAAPGPGLTELNFAVYLGDWENLPDFSKLPPHRQGEVPDNLVQLLFDDYKNQFGVVFTGKLKAPIDDEYTFLLASDDGGRILIDGDKVVEDDGIHSAAEIREGKVKLKAGDHEFRLEYFQQAGEAEIFTAWRGADFSMTPLSKWVPPDWKETPIGKADARPPMPLVVNKEAIVYRNFITGAGNRGIGVGYPGGFNLAWNAEQMNLVQVWRGAFMDAGRHWTDRGGGAQAPLGFDVFRPAGEPSRSFAVLNSISEEWPKANPRQRPDDLAWKGYTLDAKRFPTFFYGWRGVIVTERFDVEGDAITGVGKLIRTLRLTGPIPPHGYFRAATGANIDRVDGGFVVAGERFTLDGREMENTFRIAVDGAQLAGPNLLLPARTEIKITYSWPMADHAHHAP